MEHLVIEFAIVYFFWHSYLIPAIVLGVIIVFNVVAGPITDVLRFGKQKQYGAAAPPPEVRRYLMKSGLEEIRDQNLPPAMQAKIGCELLVAACDDVFSGMATDLMSEGMEHLGSIPLEHCARCKAPVFTHEATQIGGRSYCATCAKTEKATVSKSDVSERHTHDAYEEECTRCNGTGEWRGYLGVDGICYSCGGTGKRPRSRRD